MTKFYGELSALVSSSENKHQADRGIVPTRFAYFTFDKAELAVLLPVFMLSSAHPPIFTFHCQKATFSQKPHAADVNTSTDKTMMKSFFILLYSLLGASALF